MACKIAQLPSLKHTIKTHGLWADKSLGQNFLFDLNITHKIVRQAGPLTDVDVIEVGPGPGALTRAILMAKPKSLTVIEKDTRFAPVLEELKHHAPCPMTIIHDDAMQIDVTALNPTAPIIMANLPYNIATPLLTGWLKQETAIKAMYLMFQKEVAQRIVAPAGDKHYGRLGILAQWLSETDMLFTLPPEAFTPPPKVHSAVVRLMPKAMHWQTEPAIEDMERLTQTLFTQRRKMLRASLKALHKDPISLCTSLGIEPTERAENLSLEDIKKLAIALNL